MNQQEKRQLRSLHQRLLEVVEDAPNTSTYIMGATDGSVRTRLAVIVAEFGALLADDEEAEDEVAPHQAE